MKMNPEFVNKNESSVPKSLPERLPFLNVEQQPGEEDIEFSPEQREAFLDVRGKIAEELGYTVKTNGILLLALEKDGYEIHLKHFGVPSVFGINGGRISKIDIRKGDSSYYHWSRNGQEEEPTDEELKKMYDELVKYLN